MSACLFRTFSISGRSRTLSHDRHDVGSRVESGIGLASLRGSFVCAGWVLFVWFCGCGRRAGRGALVALQPRRWFCLAWSEGLLVRPCARRRDAFVGGVGLVGQRRWRVDGRVVGPSGGGGKRGGGGAAPAWGGGALIKMSSSISSVAGVVRRRERAWGRGGVCVGGPGRGREEGGGGGAGRAGTSGGGRLAPGRGAIP